MANMLIYIALPSRSVQCPVQYIPPANTPMFSVNKLQFEVLINKFRQLLLLIPSPSNWSPHTHVYNFKNIRKNEEGLIFRD